MITVSTENTWLVDGQWQATSPLSPKEGREGTIAYSILNKHNRLSNNSNGFAIAFDALTSHDITFVGIIQTAIASGLQEFPLPYVLTNCHNSLCAVGGTINEDDHIFGLSAAKKFGGEFVPAHLAVIHQYMREMYAGCGKMILGSDSHTRYGALGTLAMGEGGPELVKQLLGRTYDIARPEVVAIWLEGKPRKGVGPQDVALAIIQKLFASGFVKNKVMEFVGPGIANLSVDYRIGIDVMTTETTCLSSIWQTDDAVRQWLTIHGREGDFSELTPAATAHYEGKVVVNLSAIEPMIALPFHPSNALPINEFLKNPTPLLESISQEAAAISKQPAESLNLHAKLQDGRFKVDQCIVAGCSGGTYENMVRIAQMVKGQSVGINDIGMAVYPSSQPVYLDLVERGYGADLMKAGATVKTAFCGPCFGAGDVPANGAFSIRHTTRNFPNREGSKPTDGQISYVALMDARSIAATAISGGYLTAATDLPNLPEEHTEDYTFHKEVYTKRVYNGIDAPVREADLITGPGISPWPAIPSLPQHLLLQVACVIDDPVTTTDELIPSGETSSYRSNPYKLAEFTLSRKDPEYVGRAKKIAIPEQQRQDHINNQAPLGTELSDLFASLGLGGKEPDTGVGSIVVSVKPGDGSAREQAASCQKVLGGWANIAQEYATKRYRSNLVNWGIFPFITAPGHNLALGDTLFIEGLAKALEKKETSFVATLYRNNAKAGTLTLTLPDMTDDERAILQAGCLMNYYNQ